MDDLTINTMIPFEKELGFIKEYIRLEKLDPDRDFEVHFQLNEIDFYMPTLTLQPVVENAINYGALTCKDQKGRVEISTNREGNNIVIRVWNNFEGRRSVTEGQRKHRSIALENLKSRLKYYCDGTFDIVIGEKDALATITIPYDKAKGGLFDENDHH
jgi:LytS/YehU family sensor histidine kinase